MGGRCLYINSGAHVWRWLVGELREKFHLVQGKAFPKELLTISHADLCRD